jgi:hypothetical protein
MPQTIEAILVLLVFVIPGFVSSWILSHAYPRAEPGEARLVLEGIALSCINYGLQSWILIFFWKMRWFEEPVYLSLMAVFSLFIAPTILALTLVKVLDSEWMRSIRERFRLAHPVPKAWDRFFRQGKPCWVIATLKDGQVVAGLYGQNSFASSFPAEEDIYLERLCELSAEGKILRLSMRSLGAIIRMENVRLMEFIELEGL